MKIQKKHQYHGVAFAQIVEHKSFKALNCGSKKYGHYLINTNRHIFVKHGSAKCTPWHFTITADEMQVINSVLTGNNNCFYAWYAERPRSVLLMLQK